MANFFLLLPDGVSYFLLPDGGRLIIGTGEDPIAGGNPYYEDPYEKVRRYREERTLFELKLRQNQEEQRLREKEIARIEAARVEDLEDRELQRHLLVGLRELNKLKVQRDELLKIIEFYKRDEEDITILLLLSTAYPLDSISIN